MNINRIKIGVFSLFFFFFCLSVATAQTQLANPSFEEDAANVGNPDGWEIGKDAQVKVVTENASAGNRALLVSGGYIAVYQNLQIPKLADQQLRFSVDAKSVSDNAVIGARIGYYSDDNKWHDAALLWNKPITAEYKTYSSARTLPANAKGGRLYIAIYRSDNKSTFYVDNIKLQISAGLSDADAHSAVALGRDAQYFLNRLDATSQKNIALPQKNSWQNEAQDILKEANAAEADLAAKLDTDRQKITSLNAQLFAAMAKGKPFISETSFAFERLEPDAIPIKTSFDGKVLSLRGEYQAFGIDIANAMAAPQKITVNAQGLPNGCSINWRRQVFTDTWYTKGKTQISDPLTQLPGGGKSTFIDVDTGEMTRLFANIEIGTNAKAGNYPLTITLTGNNQSTETLTINLRILPQAAPPQKMAHYAFGYTSSKIIANHTADAVKDLVAHGVTDIEWAFMPPATFDAEGNLLKADFSRYNNLLKYFGPSPIRLNTFWQSSYASMKTADGKTLEVLSPAWNNAIVQLFQAWIKDAKEHGVDTNRVTVLTWDELHSASLETSPDKTVEQYVQIAKLLREKIPGLKNYLTLTYYSFPNDVKTALPQVDVIMPHMPVPEKLNRNAPPSYNPFRAFAEEVYPLFYQTQKERALEIGSYHVAAGRSDNLLQWNRFYPVLAAATKHTGIGFWAYNVFRGSSWDDTDGGLLDYNFVYDGTEKNPLCEKYNVTGETIVPSIRWQAVRAGLQDANIILALQTAADTGKLSPAQKTAFDTVLAKAKQDDVPMGSNTGGIGILEMQQLSQQLRALYTDIK